MGVQGANTKRLVDRKPLGPGHRLVAPREAAIDGPKGAHWVPTRPPTSHTFAVRDWHWPAPSRRRR
eukprot:2536903-Pyramimonas_sp.AAC.1